MIKTKKQIVILGAGLSGLAAGEILSKHFDVKIFETKPYIGGLAATFEKNGKRIPLFYHHIVKSNKYTLEYLKKFCEIRNLKWKKIRVAIGIDKKIFVINSFFGLLKFDYLSFYERFRLGLFGLYCLFFMKPEKLKDDLDAETWLRKYVGESVTDKIFYHLYARNKFNIPLNKISAKQFANRLYEKETNDFFTFPRQGYQCMIDGLKKEIEKNNGGIKIHSRIKEINLNEKYLIESGEKINFDILISTIPFEVFINLNKELPKNFKEKISKIRYCPAISLCFGTEDFLKKGVYWINLFNERAHIIMQHSVLADIYDNKINWCLRYGGSEEDLKLKDVEIKRIYLDVIKKYFPKVKIKWVKVMKEKYAEPIYDIEYKKHMPDYRSPIPGLYFAGIQLTYPKIRNMNSALESGMKVADMVLRDNNPNATSDEMV